MARKKAVAAKAKPRKRTGAKSLPARPQLRGEAKTECPDIRYMPADLYEAHEGVCGTPNFGHPDCPTNHEALATIYANLFTAAISDPNGGQITAEKLQQAVAHADDTCDGRVGELLAALAEKESNPLTAVQVQVLYNVFKDQHHVRLLAPFDTTPYEPTIKIW